MRNTGGKSTTSFGFDQVPLLEQSTQLEFAAGATVKINKRLSFYGQFGYIFSVGGDTDGGLRQGFTGGVGLRMTCGAPPPPPPGPIPVAAPAPPAYDGYVEPVQFVPDGAVQTTTFKPHPLASA